MRQMKSALGLIGALVPVLYCGGLIFYFVHFSGSAEDAQQIGLGPTLLGLAIVGLLFTIPLVLKIVRAIMSSHPPGSSAGFGGGGPDADAVVARYIARQQASTPPSATPTPPSRQAFGRKITE